MSRTRPLLALMALATVLGARTSSAVTIVHTNDVLGEIEPCGCRNNPMGGMARKANLLKRLPDQEYIQLDGGDLLFPTLDIPDALTKQSLLQAQFLLKSMDMTRQDAVVPGEKDFALGVATFEKLIQGTKIKFLAANLKRRNGKKLFQPHLLIKKKDANGNPVIVAVIGLVGEDLSWPKELKATSAVAAAKAEVAALRKKADFVIALTHEGEEADEALAKSVPGIDAIFGAHTQSFLQTPVVVGSTHIYQSSFRNQYIGVLPLTKPLSEAGRARYVCNDDNYKLIGLDPGYDSPAGTLSDVDQLVSEFKMAVADLNSHEEAAALASAAPENGKGELKFQTFPRCAECHLKQFDFWRKTAHAHAMDPLVRQSQVQNKECLACHTVGMGDPLGWTFVTRLAEAEINDDKSEPMSLDDLHTYLKSMNDASTLDTPVKLSEKSAPLPLRQSLNRLTRSYLPVQCENCHQPGQDHPFSTAIYSKTVEKETCLKCHTPERAPEWYKDGEKGHLPDWDKIAIKRASITCPAGEITTE